MLTKILPADKRAFLSTARHENLACRTWGQGSETSCSSGHLLWVWPVRATELYSSIKEEEGRSLEWATPLAILSHPAAEAALFLRTQIMGPRAC